MTHDELQAEVRAIVDLHQRLGDHIEILSRRLYRHFDASPGGYEHDDSSFGYRLTMTERPRKTARDDEDDGSD